MPNPPNGTGKPGFGQVGLSAGLGPVSSPALDPDSDRIELSAWLGPDNVAELTPALQISVEEPEASEYIPAYLQRQFQRSNQQPRFNNALNEHLIEYLHAKETRKIAKFKDVDWDQPTQKHRDKYSEENITRFNINATEIYQQLEIEPMVAGKSFVLKNPDQDLEVQVSLQQEPHKSKVTIVSSSTNSIDLMLSVSMEVKQNLGPKTKFTLHLDPASLEVADPMPYINDVVELIKKAQILGLAITIKDPDNLDPDKQSHYKALIGNAIDASKSYKFNEDLLPNNRPPMGRK